MRPEIQGLRAVAVMLVLLYHLWPGRLRGGYVGVDVFFVISGFLITGNLLRETERHGRVRLADFWARRWNVRASAFFLRYTFAPLARHGVGLALAFTFTLSALGHTELGGPTGSSDPDPLHPFRAVGAVTLARIAKDVLLSGGR